MSRSNPTCRFAWIAGLVTSLALLNSPGLRADDAFPAVSPDGLELKKSTRYGAVYLKPGATFSQYKRLALLDCYVDFAKDWARDYNENELSLQAQVTPQDMDRIKAGLAQEFRKVFTEELQTKGGYEIVNVAAPDVLVLRPAILNLVVNAPDLMTAGVSAAVVSSAGQMTLYLELWDSSTSTLLARAIDSEADPGGIPQVADRVTNTAAADRILRRWADLLRKRLDEVSGHAPPSP
jgi:hypothetical protein